MLFFSALALLDDLLDQPLATNGNADDEASREKRSCK